MSGKITLSIRITEELDEWLRAQAECTGRSLGEVVEDGLRSLHYQQQLEQARV